MINQENSEILKQLSDGIVGWFKAQLDEPTFRRLYSRTLMWTEDLLRNNFEESPSSRVDGKFEDVIQSTAASIQGAIRSDISTGVFDNPGRLYECADNLPGVMAMEFEAICRCNGPRELTRDDNDDFCL